MDNVYTHTQMKAMSQSVFKNTNELSKTVLLNPKKIS